MRRAALGSHPLVSGGIALVALAASSVGCADARPMNAEPSRAACGTTAAHTVASSAAARVYRTGDAVYACLRSGGRSVRLGGTACRGRGGAVGTIALAGDVVAYELHYCSVDTGSAAVAVRGLRRGTPLHRESAWSGGTMAPESFVHVTSLLVTPSGSVAWIASNESIVRHQAAFQARAVDRRGPRLLDAGERIRPRSLRLRGRRLSWRDGGTTRTATLA
jgi:hypothetical protein